MNSNFDTLNAFVLEYRKALSDYDIEQYQFNSQVFEEAQTAFMRMINSTTYINYIDKMMENMDSVEFDLKELDRFYTNVYKSVSLASKNITIPVYGDSDVEKLRPEYMGQLVTEYEMIVEQVISGKIQDTTDIKKYYANGGPFFDRVKRQVVKTSLNVTSTKDLAVREKPNLTRITNIYLQNNVIPFIRNYEKSASDLKSVANILRGQISATTQTFTVINNSIDDMVRNGKLNDPKMIRFLNYFRYNYMRGYMDVCAYTTGMLIRKTSCLTYNLASFINLYHILHEFFPEGELVLHESVIDGDLRGFDDNTLLLSMLNNGLDVVLPHIRSAIGKKKMEISNSLAEEHNFRLMYNQDISNDEYPYDAAVYDDIMTSIDNISTSIEVFKGFIGNREMVVDDMISSALLSDPFTTRFDNVIDRVSNIDYYLNQASMGLNDGGAVSLCLYNELDSMERLLDDISGAIHTTYGTIKELADSFANNNVYEGLDNATYHELKAFTEHLLIDYKEYVLALTKRIIERADKLTDTIDDTPKTAPAVDDNADYPTDYNFESVMEAYDEIEFIEQVKFEEMMKDYRIRRNRHERGIKTVFEDTTTAQADGSAPTVKTDAQAQQDQQTVQKNDAANANKADNQQNGQQNNQNMNGTKESVGLIEKFKKWVADILQKFSDNSLRLIGKNKKFLEGCKETIENLDTTNTSITMAPYRGLTSATLTTEIEGAITRVKSIDSKNPPASIKSKQTTQVGQYLFKNVPASINGTKGFDERVRHFYVFGTAPANTLTTYTGDDAKKKLQDIYAFVTGYEQMVDSVKKKFTELEEAAAAKQQEISANKSTQDTNAPQNNNSGEEKTSESSVLLTPCRQWMAGILTSLEKEYLDSIRILKALTPRTNQKNEEENKNNENANNEQNTNEATLEELVDSLWEESVFDKPEIKFKHADLKKAYVGEYYCWLADKTTVDGRANSISKAMSGIFKKGPTEFLTLTTDEFNRELSLTSDGGAYDSGDIFILYPTSGSKDTIVKTKEKTGARYFYDVVDNCVRHEMRSNRNYSPKDYIDLKRINEVKKSMGLKK